MSTMGGGLLVLLATFAFLAIAALLAIVPTTMVSRVAESYLTRRESTSQRVPMAAGRRKASYEAVHAYATATPIARPRRLTAVVKCCASASTVGLLLDRSDEYRPLSKAAFGLAVPMVVLSIPLLREATMINELGAALGNIVIALGLLAWSIAMIGARGEPQMPGPRRAALALMAAMGIRMVFVTTLHDALTSFAFYAFRVGLILFALMLAGVHFSASSGHEAIMRRYWCWWLVAAASCAQGFAQMYEVIQGLSGSNRLVLFCRFVIGVSMLRLSRDIYEQQDLSWSKTVLRRDFF